MNPSSLDTSRFLSSLSISYDPWFCQCSNQYESKIKTMVWNPTQTEHLCSAFLVSLKVNPHCPNQNHYLSSKRPMQYKIPYPIVVYSRHSDERIGSEFPRSEPSNASCEGVEEEMQKDISKEQCWSEEVFFLFPHSKDSKRESCNYKPKIRHVKEVFVVEVLTVVKEVKICKIKIRNDTPQHSPKKKALKMKVLLWEFCSDIPRR